VPPPPLTQVPNLLVPHYFDCSTPPTPLRPTTQTACPACPFIPPFQIPFLSHQPTRSFTRPSYYNPPPPPLRPPPPRHPFHSGLSSPTYTLPCVGTLTLHLRSHLVRLKSAQSLYQSRASNWIPRQTHRPNNFFRGASGDTGKL